MSPALRLALVPVVLVLGMVSRPAAASDPNSIYTVPRTVEILPDDATGTRVVIGGAFFFLTGINFTYGEPKCGYMSFQCPPGKEVMCRMQWLDIRRGVGATSCSGFGTLNMVSTATLRSDRGGTPDPWDLGMGISAGYSVAGMCPKAQMLNCASPPPPPPPDGSTPVPADAAAAADVPVLPPAADAGSPAPAADAGTPPVVADAAAPAPAPDAAPAPAPNLAKSDGCAVGGRGAPGAWPLAAALLLALALGRRARRR